jgi:dihydroneopterin aldolase
VTGVGEGESRQGTVRRLVNHVETWKTYDETNFAKSADVTHFIDFGEASKDITDVLRQNELLRCVMLAA